jgi:hypothetical protein
MRSALVLVALLACKSDKPEDKSNIVAPHVFSDVSFDLPQGWTSSYVEAEDAWQLTSGATTVRLERADERYVASPDAYMNHLTPRWKGKLVTIEDRKSVRSAGFAMTLGIYTGEKDTHPERITVVAGKLGTVWYRCISNSIDDEAIRLEVIAMCRSVHR